ncbi:hypothetical protein ACRAKI_28185 [Saccharothrix isguenensis]
MPIHLNWSAPGRRFNLANRSERARVYEIALREGGPGDEFEVGRRSAGPWFPEPDSLVVDLPLFDRAEACDITDVYTVAQRYGKDLLLARAAEVDMGFATAVFAQMLSTLSRLRTGKLPIPDGRFRTFGRSSRTGLPSWSMATLIDRPFWTNALARRTYIPDAPLLPPSPRMHDTTVVGKRVRPWCSSDKAIATLVIPGVSPAEQWRS